MLKDILNFTGGPVIQDKCTDYIKKKGQLLPGNTFVTTAGKLPAKFVIHAVGPIYQSGSQGEESELYEAVYASLEDADKKKCRSIAMPAISTGVFGYPVPKATKTIIEAVKEFIDRDKKNLFEITLASHPTQPGVLREFSKAAKQAFPDEKPQVTEQPSQIAAGKCLLQYRYNATRHISVNNGAVQKGVGIGFCVGGLVINQHSSTYLHMSFCKTIVIQYACLCKWLGSGSRDKSV